MNPSTNPNNQGVNPPLGQPPTGQSQEAAPRQRSPIEVLTQLQPMPIHPAFSAKPTPVDLLKALRKRWFLPLIVGLLCATPAAAAVWFYLPAPKHTARSVVKFSDNTIFFQLPDNDSFGKRQNLQNFQRSQVAIIKSNKLLNRALKTPEVAQFKAVQERIEPVQWLEGQIRVDFPMGPQFLRISMDGDNSEELVAIVKAVTVNYIEEMQEEERKGWQNQFENVRSLHRQFRDNVEQKRKRMRELARNARAGNPIALDKVQELRLQIINEKQKELMSLLPKVRDLERKLNSQISKESWLWRNEIAGALCIFPAQASPLNFVQAALVLQEDTTFDKIGRFHFAEILDEGLIKELMEQDPKLQSDRKHIEDIKKKIEYYRTAGVGSASRDYVARLQKDQVNYEKQLSNYQTELRTTISAKLIEHARLQSRSKLVHLQLEHNSLAQLRDMLFNEIANQESQNKKDVERGLDLNWLQVEIEQDDKLFREVAGRLTALEVEKDRLSRIRLWEEPQLYRGSAGSKQYLMVGAAGGGMLGLILFGFAWLEFRKHKVESPDELVHQLGMRIMGTLPDFSYQRKNRLLGYGNLPDAHWKTMLTDSVDATRAMLLHAAALGSLKTVMVTSAMPGEGKTSSSAHLAASLARANKKTILIDADIRKPSIHHLFELSRGPGLSELLRQEKNLSEVIRQCSVENLDLITAGSGDQKALLALAQGNFANLVEQIRDDYDFIIVDSAPVLHVPDSLVIAKDVDAVVFAILRDVSQLTKVHAAYQKLAMLNCTILGAIVNGTRDDVYSYKSKYLYTVESED